MAEEKRRDLTLRLTEDKLKVLLSCTLSQVHDVIFLARRIQSELDAQRILHDFTEESLAAWIEDAAGGTEQIESTPLIEGLPPMAPVDGRIEWAGNFFDTGFLVDPVTGAIDYRQRAAECSVRKDQLLARVFPPQEGQEGRDVFGKPVRVRKARPARIRPGQNVRLEESEGTFYATSNGRIRWVSEGLSVDPVYVIDGSVDLESGNVNHPGAVQIEKDVQEGATVKAAGDIEVKQVVEAAAVESGGSITVCGGILRGSGKTISAAGSLHARFILDADVEAGGDVAVEREIVHTKLRTRGCLLMAKGRIIGGLTMALGGITLGQAGSAAAVRTELIAGKDYWLEEQLAQKDAQLAALRQSLEKIQAVITPGKLPSQRSAAITKLLDKTDDLKAEISRVSDEVDRLKEDSRERAVFTIEIRDRVFPEVVLCIGEERLRIQEELLGPARAHLVEGRIAVDPIST